MLRGDVAKQKDKLKRAGDGPDRVYERLRRVIVEQTLAPGARLPEDAVATRFGVSRTVVRAAMTRLVTDGLVERQNNRVARVASPTQAEADDIFAARRDIEAIVVQRLLRSFPAKHVEKLRAHIRREQASGHDRPTAVRMSGEFHIMLAQATGSKILVRYVTEIIARSSLVFTAQATTHALCCSPIEHTEIIDAILKADLAAAETRMEKHLQDVADRSRQRPGPAQDFTELAADLIEPLS